MTITREFTKEQLISRAKTVLSNARTAADFHDSKPYHLMDVHLAEIALASLEAEAAGYMNKFTGRVFSLEEQPGADTDTQVYAPVYTDPPAPVVPQDASVESLATDLMKRIDNITGERHSLATLSTLRASIVESCRAAMQKKSGGTLTNEGTIPGGNSPVIPDGSTVGLFNSARALLDSLYEFGPDEVAISEYVTNMEDALRNAAAPQQEAE